MLPWRWMREVYHKSRTERGLLRVQPVDTEFLVNSLTSRFRAARKDSRCYWLNDRYRIGFIIRGTIDTRVALIVHVPNQTHGGRWNEKLKMSRDTRFDSADTSRISTAR